MSAHSTSVGRRSWRSASSTRWPASAPGHVGRRRHHQRERARAGLRRRRPGTARRRRRRPRRPGRACTRRSRATPIGRSSVRSTKSRNAIHASVICWRPVNRPVSRITSRVEALGVLDGQAQADRAAPVVDDDRRAAQVELLEQRRDRRGVAVVGVPADVGRLVGAAEAGQVGRDAAKAGVAHRRDHLAPQERPRRLAVHEARRARRRPRRRSASAQRRRPRGSGARSRSPGRSSKRSSGVRKISVTPRLIPARRCRAASIVCSASSREYQPSTIRACPRAACRSRRSARSRRAAAAAGRRASPCGSSWGR